MTGPALLALDLRDRLVVAVGGGPVSARRVRGFLDDGALVRVVAPWICEDLAALVADGVLAWLPRDYAGAPDLAGAWLVHTATGDVETDAQVASDAAAQRIWCVDATLAARGSATVPARARVNTPDGDVTIGVHAAGDPRRAMVVRAAVEDHLHSGAVSLRRRRPRPGAGWVALVGGGPGDVGLITSRGRALLATADVVVTDRLAPQGILDLLEASVRIIDVGKTPGNHPVPQHEINALLVQEAALGHGVVRLKGGDPYVLGRGGEERLACEAAGVSVEVVPGVTSAIAVPAAAGIPVTHREVARSFTVVTGHEDLPGLPVGGEHTLVILMGVARFARTADLLIAAGRDPAAPVAFIERGCTPDQRVTTTTLGQAAHVVAERGVRSPAVIVIGDVVRLSQHWDGSS